MQEIWKDVPSYEGIYEVSNLGRVKSLGRKVRNKGGFMTVKERILKPGTEGSGYLTVVLSKNDN